MITSLSPHVRRSHDQPNRVSKTVATHHGTAISFSWDMTPVFAYLVMSRRQVGCDEVIGLQYGPDVYSSRVEGNGSDGSVIPASFTNSVYLCWYVGVYRVDGGKGIVVVG